MGRVRTLVCRSESFVPIVGAVPLCETRRHWLSAVIPDGQRGQASGEQASKDHAEIAVAEQVSGSHHREWRGNRPDTGDRKSGVEGKSGYVRVDIGGVGVRQKENHRDLYANY